MAFVYGGTEVLFPAWVITAMGSGRLGGALLVGGLAYGLGFRLYLALPQRLWKRALASVLLLQSLALMGRAWWCLKACFPSGLGAWACSPWACPFVWPLFRAAGNSWCPSPSCRASWPCATAWNAGPPGGLQWLRPGGGSAAPAGPGLAPLARLAAPVPGQRPGPAHGRGPGGLGWILLLATVNQVLKPPGQRRQQGERPG
jgi:hypothetical protein